MRLFRHNGFLKLPECLPEEMVLALKEAIWLDIHEEVEPVVRDRFGRVVRISNIRQRGSLFREALAAPQVLDPLQCLLGPNIELILNRHNHATLRLAEDAGEYWHRDVLQWTRSIVTVIFYLEETNLENGCTRAIPGTHWLPGVDAPDLSDDEAIARSGILDQAVPIPMPAGGLLAIDSLLIHAPGRNHTSGTRMSMTAGYHSVDELSGIDNPRRMLLRGERIYRGNDV